jgi:NAD+ synthetase
MPQVACLQLNPTIGAFASNAGQVRNAYERAVKAGAWLVLAPELALSGYPPRDLLNRPDFVDANLRALDELAQSVGPVPLIVGTLQKNPKRPGRPLHNSAVVLRDGAVRMTVHKTLLPTYDVFDEDRYFEPGESSGIFVHDGRRIGITICEDIWNDEDFWSDRRYRRDPVKLLTQEGIDLLVNLSASPWHIGKEKTRAAMLSEVAKREKIPVVQVNMTGGNDELLFDGQSMVFNARGELCALGNAFDEDLLMADTCHLVPLDIQWPEWEAQLFYALAMGLHDYVTKCGFEKVALGLSGGIDSAVTAVLAVEALGPDNVLGVALPAVYSSRESVEDAEALARVLEIEFHVVPIQPVFEQMLVQLSPLFAGRPADTTEENLQSRIRGMALMALSNKTGRLVLTTGNKSELAVGYCTLYGDMCGGLAVISDVLKMQVYALARWINRHMEIIPHRTITKAPSAELRPHQTDQDSLPPYEILDRIVEEYVVREKSAEEIVAGGLDRAVVRDILRKIDLNEYKRRQAAPGLKVTPKAFGVGRRRPVAQRFEV